ncbi:hypothetical protein CRM22_004645 [Opisthorchis felineus]|uniref:GB1/RHD3-type G domain-containing protein n=1 Tax=Opisthorchis felineus TaxID=147828 RepID=A0A4S2LV29_OPIFE|nr:hypothetical protein CRM22_004645 [Opisthorchis felineus]
MSLCSGHAVQVVKVDEDNGTTTFTLDEPALSSILLHPSVRDKLVVIISVAGAFRQGKSFLLDFFLRYMSSKDHDNWIGSSDTPLQGFPWRGGAERDTTGILLWSEPFIIKLQSGEDVAVLFMDTQGSFDSTSTVRQCATVFALSTMLSSIQIYNIHGNIQEDHLQHLHLFTEYGRLAMESEVAETPFQHLLFLVRDWSFPYDYEFGSIGGNRLLDARLKIQPNHHTEHETVRRHIRSCFSRVSCFLLPHPGLKVATNPKFDGRLSDIDPQFLNELRVFVPTVLSPATLQLKKINGEKITCRELLTYFKAYMEIYQGDTLPEPRSMLEATAEANNLNAIMACQDAYTEAMNKVCGPDKPYINPNDLEIAHSRAFQAAIQKFTSIRKMGGEQYAAIYLERLKTTLQQLGNEYRTANTNKNIFQTFRTPAVFAVILIIFHIITGISEFVGINAVTNMFLVPFYLALVTLMTWMFLSYTGRAPELAQAIDSAADVVVEKVVTPAIQHIGQRSVQQLMGTERPIRERS